MATDALQKLQAAEKQRAAAEAEAKRLRDIEYAQRCDQQKRFNAAWQSLTVPNSAFDRTSPFPWTDCGDALCKFRPFLDTEGLTERIAANVDDVLSVANEPQMGTGDGDVSMLELVRCALRNDPDAVTNRLLALAEANDLGWASTIGNPGWTSLLWNPEIEYRRMCWEAAENAKPTAYGPEFVMSATDRGDSRANIGADGRADGEKKLSEIWLPENPEVMALHKRIEVARGADSKASENSIAIEFTEGDKTKAQSLLRKRREFIKRNS